MRGIVAVVCGLVLALNGCGGDGDTDAPSATHDFDALIEQQPDELLEAVQTAVADAPRTEVAYHQGEGAWGRGDTTLRVEGDLAELTYDPDVTVLSSDGTACFDKGGAGVLMQAMSGSYGSVRIEEDWTCAPWDFGPTRFLATGRLGEASVAALVDQLVLDPQVPPVVGVEDVEGRDLLRLRLKGPAVGLYKVWIDESARPVRIENGPQSWDVTYPEEPYGLALPEDPGAYAYVQGPGQGAAKACHQSPDHCPDTEAVWTWSDGR